MQLLQKLVSFTICASLVILLLLPFVISSQEHLKTTGNLTSNKNIIHKSSPKLLFEITLHGFLLWASMGFLMPVGVIAIRMSHREACGRRLKILFYVHSISQAGSFSLFLFLFVTMMLSVLLSTAGAVMSIKNFNNSFDNHHQRIGVGLYGMVWLQALIGFLRPRR
ncbi:hypothetical protein POTOM_009645 [Populus tomentosa]|uniref:Cytochrome b561 domain-containing protein n=1 Tax=Populus tomentosa TaxID=118781 RepID=A0A8X8AGG1_POPTO|nr:hypothetical protein POTOM_009645 [Populus tomentosa]